MYFYKHIINFHQLNFRYLFFLDVHNVTQSLKICVKKCPDRTMTTMNDICKFYKETGSQLCHDKPGNNLSACNGNIKNITGSCPELVYNSIPVLNRCIPKAIKDVGVIANLYGFINSWDIIEQILGDLYKTWKEILSLSFLAFGMIYHIIANLISFNSILLILFKHLNEIFNFSFISFYDCYISFISTYCNMDCDDSCHYNNYR